MDGQFAIPMQAAGVEVVEHENNLSDNAIQILRQLHQHNAQWIEQIERLPNGERTRMWHKLRRQLDVLDELMRLGRRPSNFYDQIRIITLIFVDRELYYLI
ncbi:hypothetical protein CAEBREN_14300 [Caenorhabditis brenneri]|uniref:Uncharacterized protein n=1 Tax=Caenorhabditis brenneri TaxID=135651 RepID=G0MXC7_CAEBE|nr:hypothetical protein CAEBREN_14300 [Caenorhabditis brenneri]